MEGFVRGVRHEAAELGQPQDHGADRGPLPGDPVHVGAGHRRRGVEFQEGLQGLPPRASDFDRPAPSTPSRVGQTRSVAAER